MASITVITCTYNAASVLMPTLMSVARQSWPGVEHIIMDGASADGTVDMAQRYAQAQNASGRGHRVVVVSERDRGLYHAMNKALARATGQYVVFLNAGDTLHSDDTLATVAQCADADGRAAVVYGDTDIVDAEGHFLRRRRLSPPEHLTWRSFRNGMLVCHQAFYARTDLARLEPYDQHYRYSADVDWCIRVMKRAERYGLHMANTHATLANYLDGGMTADNHRASLKERFSVMRKHYGLAQTAAMHAWFVLRTAIKMRRQ